MISDSVDAAAVSIEKATYFSAAYTSSAKAAESACEGRNENYNSHGFRERWRAGNVAGLARSRQRRRAPGHRLRLLGSRILSPAAGHRLLKANTQTGTRTAAHGFRKHRWAGPVAGLAGDRQRRRVRSRRLRLLAGRLLSAPAGLRLLKAKTLTWTRRAANGCRERWCAEDDREW
jgi:hypothetical protein